MLSIGHGARTYCYLGWSLLLAASLLAAGCAVGKPSGTVSGKVIFKGKPLPGGTVTFMPADTKGGVPSAIGEDGSYTVANVPAGPVTITVETKSMAPPPMPAAAMQNIPKESPNAPANAGKRYQPIPLKFGDLDASGLKFEVKAGRQDHDIDLGN